MSVLVGMPFKLTDENSRIWLCLSLHSLSKIQFDGFLDVAFCCGPKEKELLAVLTALPNFRKRFRKIFYLPLSSAKLRYGSVIEARNKILSFARENKYNSLFFCDADVSVQPDALQLLASVSGDLVSGYCQLSTANRTITLYQTMDPSKIVYDGSSTVMLHKPEKLLDGRWKAEHLNVWTVARYVEPFQVFCGCTALVLLNKTILAHDNLVFNDDWAVGEFPNEDSKFCDDVNKLGLSVWVHPRVAALHLGIKFEFSKDFYGLSV